MLNRRRWLHRSLAAGLIVPTGWYTWRIEPHWVEVVKRALPVRHLPDALQGARLVQLSDLHIGPGVDDAFLRQSFRRVESLAPDIVVYTGDFVSRSDDVFEHAGRMFGELPLGSRGTFGCLGNHDYGKDWSEPEVANRITAMAETAGVRVLRNEVAEVDGLQIVGMEDLWGRRFQARRALAGLKPQQASLVLSHNPDSVDKPGWEDYSGWILAGHTHGGQCKPPFLPPPLLPVKNRRYTAGEFTLSGGRSLYINRGLGHLLRVRFNVRPEITVFELRRA